MRLVQPRPSEVNNSLQKQILLVIQLITKVTELWSFWIICWKTVNLHDLFVEFVEHFVRLPWLEWSHCKYKVHYPEQSTFTLIFPKNKRRAQKSVEASKNGLVKENIEAVIRHSFILERLRKNLFWLGIKIFLFIKIFYLYRYTGNVRYYFCTV